MSWLMSIGAGLIAGLAGGAGAMGLAIKAVEWYRVSSFEGKSGFAVIGLTLVGALVGVGVGLIAARVGVAVGWPGFGGQLLWALGVTAALLGITAAVTYKLADIPPRLEGRTLDLRIEVRLAEDQTDRPGGLEGEVELGVLWEFRRVMRTRRGGTLRLDEARQEEGRWIVPGEVELFTSRGRRILLVTIGDKTEGFLLPLAAHPGPEDRHWSQWLPRALPPGQPAVNRWSYRYRVEPTDSDEG